MLTKNPKNLTSSLVDMGRLAAFAGQGKVGVKDSPQESTQIPRKNSMQGMFGGSLKVVNIPDIIDGVENVYTRASEWGLHFPSANGNSQSPINLDSRLAVYDEKLNENPLTLSYSLCREAEICNTGHTVLVNLRYKPGDSGYRSDVVPRSTITGGPLPPQYDYELAEFRFHWGRLDSRGSEHTVNFKAFPMELHLMHWNTTLYNTFEEAVGKPDGVAIVAIFIQVSHEHAGLKILTEHLEDIQFKGRQKTITTAFHPNCLLPDPMLRDYWTYQGSLTIPPCSERVTWIIFRYPLTVSHTQMEEFRRLRINCKGESNLTDDDDALVDNYRPTQPLNERMVKASFQ